MRNYSAVKFRRSLRVLEFGVLFQFKNMLVWFLHEHLHQERNVSLTLNEQMVVVQFTLISIYHIYLSYEFDFDMYAYFSGLVKICNL